MFENILKFPFQEVDFNAVDLCKHVDIPFAWMKLKQKKSIKASEGHGHIKSWIEKNISNTVYYFINLPTETEERLIMYLLFTELSDYVAFKTMFPECCQ